jgi:hypothetical protein
MPSPALQRKGVALPRVGKRLRSAASRAPTMPLCTVAQALLVPGRREVLTVNTRNAIRLFVAALLAGALGVACEQSGTTVSRNGAKVDKGDPDGGIVRTPPPPPLPPPVVIPPPPPGAKRWTENDGIDTWITRVSTDTGHNVYAINDDNLFAMPAGSNHFATTGSGGQFALGFPLLSVCGGDGGQAYLGFSAPERDPMTVTEAEKLQGDVDRFQLLQGGAMAFAHHYELQNSAVKAYDDTRIILSCKYMRYGPNAGELIVGSNHGFDIIHGDDYVDHRHVVWTEPTGGLAVGYVWGVNYDAAGMIYEASHWMLGALPSPPTSDIAALIDYARSVWVRNTYVVPWGSIEDPDDLDAVVGDSTAGWVIVGSMTKGMARNDYGPKKDDWMVIHDAPDSIINALEMDTDGKILVGTGTHGLWKLDPATMTFTQSPSIPHFARVTSIDVDWGQSPRTIWVATDLGLYSLSGID